MLYSSFEDMPVWQKGMELAERVFVLTETLPKKEDYGLTCKSGGQRYPFRAILQKGLAEDTPRTSSTSTTCHEVHWPKQKVI